MSRTRTPLVAAALAATVILAGCSSPASTSEMNGMDHGTSSSNPTEASDFNESDVTFVHAMLPHHQQAVTMADVLLEKTGIDPAVTTIAATIKAEQAPEISTMNSWLSKWKVPTGASSTMPGMDMGTETGMMSEADMSALHSASGSAASKLFLTQMISHHQGAIEMAKTETKAGKNADALTLATSIVSSQTTEIATMKGLLATLK